MKCNVCEYEIEDKSFNYCPICGRDLVSSDTYSPDRLNYLLGQDRDGKFIYSNFEAVRNTGIASWKKVRVIRKALGDEQHLVLHNLRFFSFVYCQPKAVRNFYEIGRYIGRCSIGQAMKTLGTERLVNLMAGTGLFWKIFEVKEIQSHFTTGWENYNAGVLRVEKIDKKDRSVYFTLQGGPNSLVKSSGKPCFFLAGCLAGQAEGLFNGYWNATEACHQTQKSEKCTFKVTIRDEVGENQQYVIEENTIESGINQLVETCIKRNAGLREGLGDSMYMGADQGVNYLLISTSIGHKILTKHSGDLVGERIAKKAGLSGEDAVFDYARDLFLYLKAGILHEPEARGERVLLRMDESVYASGVNNIHMKLDIFLAGLIEGMLKKSTGQKWLVEEAKCLANGDEYCEFACKRIN